MDQYQQYIHKSRYARYLPDSKRRETWEETVSRYIQFWIDKGYNIPDKQLFKAIHDLKIMPSMRCMMTAGPALERDNVAGYNCAYIPIDNPRSFDELMYVLMCGTGIGFSVEQKNVDQLPEVAEEFRDTDTTIIVADSKIGWASSYRELVSLLYVGKIPKYDLSKIRPAGSILKTFGGRASGPEPLNDLFQFTIEVFKKAAGRKLNSLECHDIVCKIADIVVVGGVRRSALISLSDVSDQRLQTAKSGEWWDENPQRKLANNSAVYIEKPDYITFLKEITSLYVSKSGERGFFSRKASKKIAERNNRRDTDHDFGTNPCSEIILRPYQFCNLTEVIVRPDDTLESLKEKVKLATILGTLQSTLTNFRYLRRIWTKNTEEERLLGVSLTGIMDHPILSTKFDNGELSVMLDELKNVAIQTNELWAKKLGITQAAAITCVKPSGTVSQLVNSSSGIHPRFSRFYVRNTRMSKNDPLATSMINGGFPYEEDVYDSSQWVFPFPQKSPDESVCVEEFTALEQLHIWKKYQDHWCEHKPSMTCYYTENDFLDIFAWMWHNFDDVSGISFSPYVDHIYKQAPYQPINEDTYNELHAKMPTDFNWDIAEEDDNTEAMQTLACTNGGCEI